MDCFREPHHLSRITDTLRANLLVPAGLSAGQLGVASGSRLWAVSASGDGTRQDRPGVRHGSPADSADVAGGRRVDDHAGSSDIRQRCLDHSLDAACPLRPERPPDRDDRPAPSPHRHRSRTRPALGAQQSTATLFERDQQTGPHWRRSRWSFIRDTTRRFRLPSPSAPARVLGSRRQPTKRHPNRPRVGAVETTIPLGIGSDPTSIIATGNRVWVARLGDGTVARIDASTNILRRLVVGGSPNTVAATGGRIWVSVQAGLDANEGGIPAPLAAGTSATLGLSSSICSPVYAEGTPKVIIAGDLPLQGFGASSLTLQLSNAIRYELALHHFRGRGTAGRLPALRRLERPDRLVDTTHLQGRRTRDRREQERRRCHRPLQLRLRDRRAAHPRARPSRGSAGHQPLRHVHRPHPRRPRRNRRRTRRLSSQRYACVHARRGLRRPPGRSERDPRKELGVRRLYLLADGSAYGRGLASAVKLTAKQTRNHDRWPVSLAAQHAIYRALARHVAKTHPDGVFLAGTIDEGGPPLIQQLRHALGTRTHILLSDGFTPFPVLLAIGPPSKAPRSPSPAPP